MEGNKRPERLFAVPGKNHLRIDAMYAWVCTEPEGGEGIPAITVAGSTMPLIGADVERIRSLRHAAEELRRQSGYPVRLVRFSMREDLEELP